MRSDDPRVTILADGLRGIQAQAALLTKMLGEMLSDGIDVKDEAGQGQQLPPMAGRNINRAQQGAPPKTE